MLQSTFVVCCTYDMTGLCGVDSGNARNKTDHGECSVSENGRGNFIEILLQNKTDIKNKYAV